MSRSPAGLEDSPSAQNPPRGFRQHLQRLDQLLENGESWSGNERNCVFLNLGTDSSAETGFAPVSGLTGLGFADDSRAHALCDWDRDGDVDIWTTNRTSPRLRFLRNDAPGDQHFLAVRLIGNNCNRDAIGARMEVILPDATRDAPHKRLVRSLRAGEGFLAQSTKWLHFGLGQQAAIDSIRIHWPGGDSQTVQGLKIDSHYEIAQGEPPRRLPRPPKAQLQAINNPSVPSSDSAQILLSSRLPLPALPVQRFDGSSVSAAAGNKAIWLSLWASWCQPCVAELQQANNRAEELRQAGLDVLALSLDGFDIPDAEATDIEDARRLLKRMGFSFQSATATAEMIRRLQFAEKLLFGRQSEMVLPTSYLLDAKGRLAAVYRGPISVDRLLEDAKHLADDPPTLLSAALPFPGVWFDGRRRFAPIAIVADLLDHAAADDALEYVKSNRNDLARQPGYVEVIGQLGTTLAQHNQMQSALQMYQWSLEADPENVAVLNNMAWYLATNEDPAVRDPQQAIRYAESAARITRFGSASILDTLAASYVAGGDLERARITLDQAIQLARQQGQAELAKRLEAKRADLP